VTSPTDIEKGAQALKENLKWADGLTTDVEWQKAAQAVLYATGGKPREREAACAECGAPWNLPEAGQCYLHPCTKRERERWRSVSHGMDMNQRARHASGWRAARLFFAAPAEAKVKKLEGPPSDEEVERLAEKVPWGGPLERRRRIVREVLTAARSEGDK
jgi:hypothetical protein